MTDTRDSAADEMIDQLNVLCEDFGCEPGSDRLHWLHDQLSSLRHHRAFLDHARARTVRPPPAYTTSPLPAGLSLTEILMTDKADGGPAFPINPETNMSHKGEIYPETMGMSLRDWFAGHALAGLLANPNVSTENWACDARNAYAAADAMIAARKGGAS